MNPAEIVSEIQQLFHPDRRKLTIVWPIVTALFVLSGFSTFAASQTWTNAPVNQYWTNSLNWDGGAYPGALNLSNSTINADVATFNTAIPGSNIGGAPLPIITADSTVISPLPATNRCLQISGMIFDTANCGAYVFEGNTPVNYPTNGILFVSHGGSITMSSTVNSSQTFLVPVFIRLPTAIAGQYSFVNNAVNPAATMYFAAITNDSVSTRGTVFTLDGSNTGTNTIAYVSRGSADFPNTGSSATAGQGFTKQGTGTWIVQNIGGSDFQKASVNNINDGKLIIVDSGMWGFSTNVAVNSNAVEVLVNCGQTNTTISGNGTVQVSGAGNLATVAIGTGTGVTPHLSTTISGDVLCVGGVPGVSTALTGGLASSVVHIGGPGTVLLSTNSSYDGNISADTGTLQIGAMSALGTGPSLNIAAGAIVDLTPLGAGITFNPTTTGISASGTGTTVGSTAATIKPDTAGTLDLATGSKNISLTYNPTSFTGDSSHPALYLSQGTLNLSGNFFTVNNASGTPLGAGTYVLVAAASGNINNAGNLAANVTGSGLASGDVGTISVSGGSVDLVVTAHASNHLVWEGGNPNDNWDTTTPNWFNGVTSTVYSSSDSVTFNAMGASNPIVNLVGLLIPSQPVLVDTTATNYQFIGSGSIGSTASLTKMGTGTLIISNLNTYMGSTVVSNGTVQLGTNNVLSDNSDVILSNTATLDLNSWNASIGALNGGGTVDTIAGGTPTLTVGVNADSGNFSGTIKNTTGTLTLNKVNTGTEILSGSNNYVGATTINGGTLTVANPNALGSGNSAVTINSGTTLDVATNVEVASIAGTGSIENNLTTTANQLDILGSSTINALIADGSSGGEMSVLIGGGTTTFEQIGTYSGGTIVAGGATLAVQNASPSPNPGTGEIILSNNATLAMPGISGSPTANIGNTIVTVNNAEASFTAASVPNNFSGQFVGNLTATNLFYGDTMTIGGAESFINFLGTVIVTNGPVRGDNALQGGPNTTFDFIGGGGWYVRVGGDTVHFGCLSGDLTATISNPSFSTPGNYIIGAANQNSTYSGSISGSNNIVKTGAGTLTLDGGRYIYPDTGPIVPEVYGTNAILYVGTTTISNGVLALVVPSLLTNSPTITLAGASAMLDASAMGYVSNEFDQNNNLTNSFPVTNSTFELISNSLIGPQTMGGVGTLKGNLIADPGTILSPGLPTGLFNVTGNATLSGAINMNLDTTNAAASSEFVANTLNVNPSATLVVTNLGPGLLQHSTFQLFNRAVSFSSVTLPATDPTGTTNYIWQNWLALNGTITLTNGGLAAPAIPPVLGYSISSNVLTLSWNSAYKGFYILQEQTNPLSLGLTTNWTSIQDSANVNSTNITINPTNPSVFFRLLYQ